MLNKLTDAEKRYLEIEQKLSEPDIFSDTEKYTALMKEYKALTPIIEKFREYKATDKEAADLKAMLDEPLDTDMRELAASEYKDAKARIEVLRETPTTIKTLWSKYEVARAARKRLSLRRCFTVCTQCTPRARALKSLL